MSCDRNKCYKQEYNGEGCDTCSEQNTKDMITDEQAKEKIYKHTYFMIGETLVEESKQHITSEKACEQIREYLNEMRWKLNKESEKEGDQE